MLTTHDQILREDMKKYREFHDMRVTGNCDSNCGRLATHWFGNTSAATCGTQGCINVQQEEYNETSRRLALEDKED